MTNPEIGDVYRSKWTGEVREVTDVWLAVNGQIIVDYSRPVKGDIYEARQVKLSSFNEWAKNAEVIEEKETV